MRRRAVSKRAERVAFAVTIAIGAVAAIVACNSDPDQGVLTGYGSSSGMTGFGADGGESELQAQAEALFRALQTDLVNGCGGLNGNGECHVNGTYQPTPPTFLAPDPYTNIKALPGAVTSSPFSSIILTKGQHEGPSLDSLPNDLDTRVTAWLNAEALALAAIPLPTTDPFPVVSGPNDIDISKAATGLTGVHLQFTASFAGGVLVLSKITLGSTTPGTAIHIQHPLFLRSPLGKAANVADTQDPQDSFSNSDQTVPGGTQSTLSPGIAVFSGSGWTPWATGDLLRLEVHKLEPGTITEASAPPQCSSVANFQANVVPKFFAGNNDGTPLNCTGTQCHGKGGTGQGGLDLSGIAAGDYAGACAAVLNKVNKTTPASSLIIQYPTKTGNGQNHPGGAVTNTATYTTDFEAIITGNTVF